MPLILDAPGPFTLAAALLMRLLVGRQVDVVGMGIHVKAHTPAPEEIVQATTQFQVNGIKMRRYPHRRIKWL